MWDEPRKYLIVFTQRGGSTFLAHCLDSHPDIGCERGEPLLGLHPWLKACPEMPPEQILSMLLDRPGYPVTVARITYRHRRLISSDFLEGVDGIIHLHRHNVARILISSTINTAQLKPAHTYDADVKPAQVEIKPKKLLADIAKYLSFVRCTCKLLHELDVPLLMLRYDEIVGGEGQDATHIPEAVGRRICQFLGVEYRLLWCKLKRTNPEPLSEIITNWLEVKKALNKAGYGGYFQESRSQTMNLRPEILERSENTLVSSYCRVAYNDELETILKKQYGRDGLCLKIFDGEWDRLEDATWARYH